MVTTKQALDQFAGNLTESVGNNSPARRPVLAPVVNERDISRRPLANAGTLDIDRITPDPGQPRRQFDESELEQLAASLRDRGQLSPIRVRWCEDATRWIIVSGERRWRAARLAGLKTVNCLFVDDGLEASEVLAEQLIENIQREDLEPLEEARAFQRLIELNEWSRKQLADNLRINPSYVTRLMALLTLPVEILSGVEAGQIPVRTAYELSREKNPEQQKQLGLLAARGKLSHTAASSAVSRRYKGPRKKKQRLSFATDHGVTILATVTGDVTYHHIEAALLETLEEVRLRVSNNVALL